MSHRGLSETLNTRQVSRVGNGNSKSNSLNWRWHGKPDNVTQDNGRNRSGGESAYVAGRQQWPTGGNEATIGDLRLRSDARVVEIDVSVRDRSEPS